MGDGVLYTPPVQEVETETTEVATEEVVDPLNNPAVNKAAFDFNRLIPQIRTQVGNMSLRQLSRVMIAVAEFPLGNTYPKFISQKESELFMMMLHAEGLKGTMKAAVLANAEALKEIQEQAVKEVVAETLQTETKGET